MRTCSLSSCSVDRIVGDLLSVLRSPGGVALVPTETVYGLIARVGDEVAEARIYRMKDRPAEKRLGWFTGDWHSLTAWGVELKGWPEKLAAKYLPGPLTIIAPVAGGGTVGFRMPDSPLLSALLRQLDCPLLQTSANLSGQALATTCAGAAAQLTEEPDLAVDGGPVGGGALASTVVDATGTVLRVLRRGALNISEAEL